MIESNFSAAIFDLDGTLLDSLGVWTDIDREFLKKRGIAVPNDYQDAIKCMSMREAADYTAARFMLKESADELIAEWLDMAQTAYATTVGLKPFAKEYLEALHKMGVRLAVATSSARELFVPALKRNGIWELFSATVTTAEVGRGKEFPDVYLKAADLLGARPEDCAVFEDVPAAVRTARKAGFYTVAVQDNYSLHEEAELRALANEYLSSFGELL